MDNVSKRIEALEAILVKQERDLGNWDINLEGS